MLLLGLTAAHGRNRRRNRIDFWLRVRHRGAPFDLGLLLLCLIKTFLGSRTAGGDPSLSDHPSCVSAAYSSASYAFEVPAVNSESATLGICLFELGLFTAVIAGLTAITSGFAYFIEFTPFLCEIHFLS